MAWGFVFLWTTIVNWSVILDFFDTFEYALDENNFTSSFENFLKLASFWSAYRAFVLQFFRTYFANSQVKAFRVYHIGLGVETHFAKLPFLLWTSILIGLEVFLKLGYSVCKMLVFIVISQIVRIPDIRVLAVCIQADELLGLIPFLLVEYQLTLFTKPVFKFMLAFLALYQGQLMRPFAFNWNQRLATITND